MKPRERTSMDPAKQPKTTSPPKDYIPTPSEPTPTAKTPTETQSTISIETPKPASQAPQPHPVQTDSPKKVPAKSGTQPETSIPLSRDYTRKFLTGRLLHPTTHYTSLPPHPATTSLHHTLTATHSHIFFPISGPGGRIAILSLANPGRHETPTTFSTGAALVDFDVSAYVEGWKVVTAGEDGVVTAWDVSAEGEGGGELNAMVKGLDKVIQVMWHPFVEGLIAILCVEAGKTEIQLWDSMSSNEGERKRVPLEYAVYPDIFED